MTEGPSTGKPRDWQGRRNQDRETASKTWYKSSPFGNRTECEESLGFSAEKGALESVMDFLRTVFNFRETTMVFFKARRMPRTLKEKR
jgi:hypothetical protein